MLVVDLSLSVSKFTKMTLGISATHKIRCGAMPPPSRHRSNNYCVCRGSSPSQAPSQWRAWWWKELSDWVFKVIFDGFRKSWLSLCKTNLCFLIMWKSATKYFLLWFFIPKWWDLGPIEVVLINGSKKTKRTKKHINWCFLVVYNKESTNRNGSILDSNITIVWIKHPQYSLVLVQFPQ